MGYTGENVRLSFIRCVPPIMIRSRLSSRRVYSYVTRTTAEQGEEIHRSNNEQNSIKVEGTGYPIVSKNF